MAITLQTIWNAKSWIPFTLKTIGYGSISLVVGPFTPEYKASLWAMRNWCRSSTKGLGMNIVVSGLENIPEAPFVYCSNHQSIVDIICLGSVLPHDYKWAAKRSVMNVPFLGWHLRMSGHIPVDRGAGPEVAAKVIGRYEETLQKGKPILVFPEGTRSETGIVKGFKKGPFIAAVHADVPVVPVALDGTHDLMEKGAPVMHEENMRDVFIKVGKPLRTNKNLSEEEQITDLRDRTRASILRLHASIGGKLPEDAPSVFATAAE